MPFDGTKLTEVQRVLLDAAKEVRKGWCQHEAGPWAEPTGNVCAIGALARIADGGSRTYYKAAYRLERYLNGVVIPDWNDEPGRTAEEVAAALEAAAFMEIDDG